MSGQLTRNRNEATEKLAWSGSGCPGGSLAVSVLDLICWVQDKAQVVEADCLSHLAGNLANGSETWLQLVTWSSASE